MSELEDCDENEGIVSSPQGSQLWGDQVEEQVEEAPFKRAMSKSRLKKERQRRNLEIARAAKAARGSLKGAS